MGPVNSRAAGSLAFKTLPVWFLVNIHQLRTGSVFIVKKQTTDHAAGREEFRVWTGKEDLR